MNLKFKILLAAGTLAAGLAAFFGLRKETEESLRDKVVRAAESQVGNNDPSPYWLDVTGMLQPASQSWCGAFALWALHQAGLARFKNWIMGSGFILTQPMPLPTTYAPKRGDIAYFHDKQHQAVVGEVYADGTMRLINGNGVNRTVTADRRPISSAAAVYSIQPYIDNVLMAA